MSAAASLAIPAIICYSVSPNAYLTEHAADIRGLYDGFYFVCGSWESGVENAIGVDGNPPKTPAWMATARQNVAALRRAGVMENLLGVSFGQNEAWPSPQTLLSDEFTAKMHAHFAALGRAAREAGFRGVSIDVEYPYPRYQLNHPIYTYQGYTPGQLMDAAYRQGRASMAGVLDEFPEAVVFLLPGTLRMRPIERQYMLGLLDEMAERDAPGGYHLATEFAYSMNEDVTHAAITRMEDAGMEVVLSPKTLDYWRRRCSMAPGMWPLHMVETEPATYPLRPWEEELAELRREKIVLQSLAKRYMWSYSGQPIYLLPTEANRRQYGLGARFREAPAGAPADYSDAMKCVTGWHAILRDRRRYEELPDADPRFLRLMAAVRAYDEGRVNAEALCSAFGTPGRWWALGPLGNPHTKPAFTADEALMRPINRDDIYYGRDGAVRWTVWNVLNPTGLLNASLLYGYLGTDDQSTHFACWVHTDRPLEGTMHVNWDDGIIIRLGDQIVFSRPDYPPQGHGLFYLDRYLFEEHVPVSIPAGATRITVTEINARGLWQWAFRITDRDGYPFEGVRFTMSE